MLLQDLWYLRFRTGILFLQGGVYCSKVNIRSNTSVVVNGADSQLDGEGQIVLLEEQVVEGTKKTIRVNIELD